MKILHKIVMGCVVLTLAFSAGAAERQSKGKNDYTRTVARPYEEVLAAGKTAAHGSTVIVQDASNVKPSVALPT